MRGMFARIMIGARFRIFLFSIFYVIFLGGILQLIVIPLSPWHGSSGLLAGGDWIGFHAAGLDLAHNLRNEGWGEWVWRINGHAPASVAALMYFLTGLDTPLVLLPLHGVLFGVTLVVAYSLLRVCGFDPRISFFCVMPLYMLPSGAMIWGQIHNDIYSITGFFLVIYFWAKLCALVVNGLPIWRWADLLLNPMLLVSGMALVLYVRPYLGEVIIASSLAFSFFIFTAFFVGNKRTDGLSVNSSCYWGRLLMILVTILFGLVLQVLIVQIDSYLSRGSFPPVGHEAVIINMEDANSGGSVTGTSLLQFLNGRVEELSARRGGFLRGSAGSGSAIDLDVSFSNIGDLISYIPRASQIALFSPFPSHWVGEAVKPGGGAMRSIVAFEMVFLYFMFLGFLGSATHWQFMLPLIGAFVFAVVFSLIYSLVVSNVGTLYRMRYPAMLIWIIVGMACWLLRLRSMKESDN